MEYGYTMELINMLDTVGKQLQQLAETAGQDLRNQRNMGNEISEAFGRLGLSTYTLEAYAAVYDLMAADKLVPSRVKP
jgi:hypothetical protein